jgi:HIRAN domain-containing protein
MTSCGLIVLIALIGGTLIAVYALVFSKKPPPRSPVPGDDPFRPFRTDLASPPPPRFRADLILSRDRSGGHDAVPPRLPGPSWLSASAYGYKVTGTSHYQDALEAICGGRTEESVEHEETAQLILETANPYDRNAVRIEIQGRHVGYLSRDDAKAFRERVAGERLPGDRFPCPTLILGGWDRDGDQGSFGLRLALALYG